MLLLTVALAAPGRVSREVGETAEATDWFVEKSPYKEAIAPRQPDWLRFGGPAVVLAALVFFGYKLQEEEIHEYASNLLGKTKGNPRAYVSHYDPAELTPTV